MMRNGWVWMIAVLALAGSAWCQTFDQSIELSSAMRDGPPAQVVMDDVDVLRHMPELKAEIEQRIRELETKHQFRIRLLIRPVWMGGTVQEMAASIQQVWFPNGDGLVMIVEADNRKLGLGMPLEGRPDEATWLMPTHVSAIILKRVADRADYNAPMEEFLRGLVFDMVGEHERYFEERKRPPPKARVMREMLFLIGGAASLAIGALAVAAWTGYSRKKEGRIVLRFPEVSCPERLGAPYGGGNIAVRRFGNRQS